MNKRTTQGTRLVLTLALFALAACTTPKYETVDRDLLDDIQAELALAKTMSPSASAEQPPEEVLQALVPGLTLESVALQPVEERFDFAVQEPMEAREFFSLLTAGTTYSIAIHPGISGSISALDLKNVTIQEALDQVSALYGYSIKRSGNIFQVTPGGLETRIFKVDYLNVNRNGNSNMSVVTSGLQNTGMNGGMNNLNGMNGINGGVGGFNNINQNNLGGLNGQNGNMMGGMGGGMNSGGANVNTTSEADYWEDLEDIISSIIGGGAPVQQGAADFGLDTLTTASATERAVIVSPQTGMVVVRAYPHELDQVADFLAQSQDSLQRQVVLEAKILEVTLNESFQSGVDLRAIGTVNSNGNTIAGGFDFLNSEASSGANGNGTPSTPPLGQIPLAGDINLSAGAGTIGYFARDFASVIRLLETQGAVQVVSSPRITTLNNQKAVFKVGGEQYFSTNPTSSVVQGSGTATSNQNANLQPFFSGIALDVTPQISSSGDIILHVHPLLNEVSPDEIQIGSQKFPLAKSETRESDSIARARNGEVVIISGLMQTRVRGEEAGVPVARNVPIVGNAFEQTQRETVKTELVILLRAIVDEDGSMQNLIQEHTDSFDAMRRQVDPYYR